MLSDAPLHGKKEEVTGMKNMDISAMSAEDAAVVSLRRCGHFLHHSASGEQAKTNAELLAVLSEEEKAKLTELLQKCLKHWETL